MNLSNNSEQIEKESGYDTSIKEDKNIDQEKLSNELGISNGIKQFDILKVLKERHNFAMILYGKRRSGKSLLLRDFASKIQKWYKNAYVFSETISLQPDLFDFIPSNNRFNDFNQDKMQEIWDTQEKYIKYNLANGIKDKTKLDHLLIIFDDVIQDPHIRNSEIFNKLFTAGRHSNIAVIVLSQEVGGRGGINKVSRRNADIIGSFYMQSEDDRKLIAEQFLSGKSKREGMALINDLTTPSWQCALFDCTSLEREYSDFIGVYKAKINLPKFQIGKDSYKMINIPTKSYKLGKKVVGTIPYSYKVENYEYSDPLMMSNGLKLDQNLALGSRLRPVQRIAKNIL